MNRKDRRARLSNKSLNYKTRPVAKNRQLEAELRSAAHGRTVLMECATCPRIPEFFQGCNEGGDFPPARGSHPLQWESKVLGMDASGAVLSEPFCPSCTRRGRRSPVTEQDGTGLTQAELDQIGPERTFTLAFLLTQMMNVDDYRKSAQLYPLLTVGFIAKHTCQLKDDVEWHLHRLETIGWLDLNKAGKDAGSPQFKFAFGFMWNRFFERINAKKEQQITDAPKKVLAIDCGHESPFQIMGMDELHYLDAAMLAEFREQIATGEIELHRPLLCPECDAKEKARD